MNNKLKEKLKIEYRNDTIKQTNGIPVFLNDKFLSGDNQKYMKMYDWMSNGYDLVENIVGKLKYGNTINKMRSETISKLEWRDNSSV